MMGNFWTFAFFCIYLLILAAIIYGLNRKKKLLSPRLNTWIYALAMSASFLTGWTFLGISTVFARGNFNFMAFYIGIILFSFLFPFLLEKIYAILQKSNVNDIISFVLLRYQNHSGLKSLLLILILFITLPYLALNFKSLEILFGEEGFHWFFFIASLFLIFLFVFYIREWKGITVVAIQGLVMFLVLLFLGIFILFSIFLGPSFIFNRIVESPLSHKIQSDSFQSLASPWIMILIISTFSFLFLLHQFSILSQGLNLNPREKIFKISILVIPFFIVLNFFEATMGGGLIAYFWDQQIPFSSLNGKFILEFFQDKGGSLLFFFFLIGGFAFVLSTLNQQLISLSDILKKHLKLKFTFRNIIEDMTKHIQESRKKAEFRFNQMEKFYKFYLKIGLQKSKKAFFESIAKNLPLHYPEILKINYIRNQSQKTLFQATTE